MLVKKTLWSLIAATVLMNTGCCRMWERWCDRPHAFHGGGAPNHCQPQQCTPVPQQYVCPPGSYYSPQSGVATIPPAPGSAGWQRPGCP